MSIIPKDLPVINAISFLLQNDQSLTQFVRQKNFVTAGGVLAEQTNDSVTISVKSATPAEIIAGTATDSFITPAALELAGVANYSITDATGAGVSLIDNIASTSAIGYIRKLRSTSNQIDVAINSNSVSLEFLPENITSIGGVGALTLSTGGNNDIILSPSGTGQIDANFHRIRNVSMPISAGDATSKSYVDAVAVGIRMKGSVKAKTTDAEAAIIDAQLMNGSGAGKTITSSANGILFPIDGVSLGVSDRVLFAGSTASPNYGIYRVVSLGSLSTPWVLMRTEDFDNSPTTGEVFTGVYTFVEGGTEAGLTGWSLLTLDPIDLDNTPLTWTVITSTGGGAVEINGLSDATKESSVIILGAKRIGLSSSHVIVSPDWNPVSYTGGNNTIIGAFSGNELTTGNNNAFCGIYSGNAVTFGAKNTFYGNESGLNCITGSYNTCVGFQANTGQNSSFNTVFGHNIGGNLASGSSNVLIGDSCAIAMTEGSFNIVIGKNAGASIDEGESNVIIGSNAGAGTISSLYNVAIGDACTTGSGSSNIAIGANNGSSVLTGFGNVTIGVGILGAMIALNNCTIIGTDSVRTATGLGNSTIIGKNNETGNNDGIIILGRNSGTDTMTGNNNTIIGNLSGNIITSGNNNTIIGNQSGNTILDGAKHIIIGNNSSTNASERCIILGHDIGGSANGGNDNIFIGHETCKLAASPVNNVVVGNLSANANLFSGQNNAFLGNNVCNNATSLSQSVIIGDSAQAGSTGVGNIVIGHNAGLGLTTGSENILIGLSANATGTIGNSIGIGKFVNVTANNSFFINSDIAGNSTAIANVTNLAAFNGVTGRLAPIASPASPNQVLSYNGTALEWSALNSFSGSQELITNQAIVNPNVESTIIDYEFTNALRPTLTLAATTPGYTKRITNIGRVVAIAIANYGTIVLGVNETVSLLSVTDTWRVIDEKSVSIEIAGNNAIYSIDGTTPSQARLQCVSKNGATLLFVSGSTRIDVYNFSVATNRYVSAAFYTAPTQIDEITISGNGQVYAIKCSNDEIRVVSINNTLITSIIPGTPVKLPKLSYDGRTIVFVSNNNVVETWRHNGTLFAQVPSATFTAPTTAIHALTSSGNGNTVAFANRLANSGNGAIWVYRNGTLEASLPGLTGSLNTLGLNNSIDMTLNGDTFIIGATNPNGGNAIIYSKLEYSQWVIANSFLTPLGIGYGSAVAINNSGTHFCVTSIGGPGVVHFYQKINNNYEFNKSIMAPVFGLLFGNNVSMTGQGNRVFVSAFTSNPTGTGAGNGALFEYA